MPPNTINRDYTNDYRARIPPGVAHELARHGGTVEYGLQRAITLYLALSVLERTEDEDVVVRRRADGSERPLTINR